MAQVIWTKKAFQQLERAIKYIHDEQGVAYARIVLEKILTSTKQLKTQPEIGKIETLLLHKKHDYRFLIVWSFKIIYRNEKIR